MRLESGRTYLYTWTKVTRYSLINPFVTRKMRASKQIKSFELSTSLGRKNETEIIFVVFLLIAWDISNLDFPMYASR